MNKKILIDIVGILLLVLIVLIGYKLSPLLMPKADFTVDPDPACNLQLQACTVTLPGGERLTVEAGTRPIPLVRSFQWRVLVPDAGVRRVDVDFSGVDMDMGFNRPQLQAAKDGMFVADVSLPVCVTGRMTWQATVLLETASARIAVPFRFVTGEP